jgi:hypothetical protein
VDLKQKLLQKSAVSTSWLPGWWALYLEDVDSLANHTGTSSRWIVSAVLMGEKLLQRNYQILLPEKFKKKGKRPSFIQNRRGCWRRTLNRVLGAT